MRERLSFELIFLHFSSNSIKVTFVLDMIYTKVSSVRKFGTSCFLRAWCSSSAKPDAKFGENRFLTKEVVEETLKNKGLKYKEPVIGLDIVESLERLSLVNFANEAGLLKLRETVKFASAVTEVDTSGVEPLVTLLEDT